LTLASFGDRDPSGRWLRSGDLFPRRWVRSGPGLRRPAAGRAPDMNTPEYSRAKCMLASFREPVCVGVGEVCVDFDARLGSFRGRDRGRWLRSGNRLSRDSVRFGNRCALASEGSVSTLTRGWVRSGDGASRVFGSFGETSSAGRSVRSGDRAPRRSVRSGDGPARVFGSFGASRPDRPDLRVDVRLAKERAGERTGAPYLLIEKRPGIVPEDPRCTDWRRGSARCYQ
jgi:hypothetical protein